MSIDRHRNRLRVRARLRGHRVAASFATHDDAAAFEARWRAAILDGGPIPEPPGRPAPPIPDRAATVGDAAREFVRGARSGAVRTRRGHAYKPSTVRGHENRLRLYVMPAIGAVPLTALTRGDVRRLVSDIAASRSPATAANVRDALRLVLARQVELEVIDDNPAAGVRAPSFDHAAARFLTADEADRLQAAADAHDHPGIAALVAVALGTGARLGELQAMTWGPDGVDVDARTMRVAATRDRTGDIVTTKNRRARVVPVGDDIVARMRRYRLAVGRPPDGARVFPRSHRRAWEQVRDAAGLPGLRVHDLRHTAATFWLAAGLTVHAVAELLGHTDAALVLRLYGHALPREVATAGDRLEAWRAAQRR